MVVIQFVVIAVEQVIGYMGEFFAVKFGIFRTPSSWTWSPSGFQGVWG